MSLPVDKSKSDAARAQGNASFKKGRWTESIGHYTNAVLHNLDDPLAYANRAQAYLRLDKYDDAERDCTAALDKQPGHIKALFRRALARKGLERYEEALADLNSLLSVDEGNETAREELQEVQVLRDRQQAAMRTKPKRPPSPPRLPTAVPTQEPSSTTSSTSTSLASDGNPAKSDARQDHIADPRSRSPVHQSPAPTTFAALRTARAGKKSAYISPHALPVNGEPPASDQIASASKLPPSTRTAATPMNEYNGSTAAASLVSASPSGPDARTAHSASTGQSERTNAPAAAVSSASPNPQTAASSKSAAAEPAPIRSGAPKPPTDPLSTSPGTGILLIRALGPLSPADAWSLLRLYPPSNLPVILGSILEPDSLGLVLAALAHGSSPPGVAEDQERAKAIMLGLRGTSRIGMNAMMLDQPGAEAAKLAWRNVAGEGSWP